MPCYSPLKGYRARKVNPQTGKRSVVFNRNDGFPDLPVELPCGQCIGCRLERSRQWAMRCVHEASQYEDNCFITLTYDDEHLPSDGSLCLEHFQKFMKRLRKRFGNGIRFFHCGEYGEKFSRPHYHACLFNFDFSDKILYKKVNGIPLYTSKSLEELWTFGFSTVGNVTFESAAYIARYVTKKVNGKKAEAHYGDFKPEYITMSRRPGIGTLWFHKFKADTYRDDYIILRGKKLHPPKFYDSLYEVEFPSDLLKLKRRRKAKGLELAADNTFDRLEVKEFIKRQQINQLNRRYEHVENVR